MRLEKVIIPNYNTHKLLTFTQKKKKKKNNISEASNTLRSCSECGTLAWQGDKNKEGHVVVAIKNNYLVPK